MNEKYPVVSQDYHEDEIDLVEIIGIGWAYRYLIIGLSVFGFLAGVFFATMRGKVVEKAGFEYITEHPLYTYLASSSVYFPTVRRGEEDTEGETYGFVARQILLSTATYEKMAEEFDLFSFREDERYQNWLMEEEEGFEQIARLSELEQRALFNNLLTVNFDRSSFLLTANFTHPNRETALGGLRHAISLMEERLNQLGLGNSFQILEEASLVSGGIRLLEPKVEMEKVKGRGRALFAVLGLIVGFMGACFLALVLNFYRRIKNDPVAMKKLRGEF